MFFFVPFFVREDVCISSKRCTVSSMSNSSFRHNYWYLPRDGRSRWCCKQVRNAMRENNYIDVPPSNFSHLVHILLAGNEVAARAETQRGWSTGQRKELPAVRSFSFPFSSEENRWVVSSTSLFSSFSLSGRRERAIERTKNQKVSTIGSPFCRREFHVFLFQKKYNQWATGIKDLFLENIQLPVNTSSVTWVNLAHEVIDAYASNRRWTNVQTRRQWEFVIGLQGNKGASHR